MLCSSEINELKIKTEYTEERFLDRFASYCPLGSIKLDEHKPGRFKNFKYTKDFNYYFGEIEFNTINVKNIFPFVIQIQGDDWQNAVLYIDRDRDFDFSTGTTVEYPQKGRGVTGFRCLLELDLTYSIHGNKILQKYRALLVANFKIGATLISACSWKGVLTIGSEKYNFIIVDDLSDGDFSLIPERCGSKQHIRAGISIDFNQNGKIDGKDENLNIGEKKHVGKYVLGLTSISPIGEEVTFTIQRSDKQRNGSKDVLQILQEYPNKGNPAPYFSFVDLNGNKISLDNLKGRIVLLDFWATWCSPCLKSIPTLKRCHEKYKDEVTFIGISLDKDKHVLRKFLKQEKIFWTQYCDGRGWDNKIAKLYKVESIPALFLIDRSGIVYSDKLYPQSLEGVLEGLLSKDKQR